MEPSIAPKPDPIAAQRGNQNDAPHHEKIQHKEKELGPQLQVSKTQHSINW